MINYVIDLKQHVFSVDSPLEQGYQGLLKSFTDICSTRINAETPGQPDVSVARNCAGAMHLTCRKESS